MMKLPIKISLRHRGKVLWLDSETESMMLFGPTGEPIGAVSWKSVVDFIQGKVKEVRSHQAARNYPRGRFATKVRHVTSAEVGFIETQLPPELGAALALELVLPDNPTAPINAQGKVAWMRPKEERYVFFPGVGVQFTEIPEVGRTHAS